MRQFSDLSEQEVLALAISLEEEHARIYADYAAGLAEHYPGSAKVFEGLAAEENEHRGALIDRHREVFGNHIPLVRPQDVGGFLQHKPIWLVRPLRLDKVRAQAEAIEAETLRFYDIAAQRTTDAGTRKLLGDLAAAERRHASLAARLMQEHLAGGAGDNEEEARRRVFVLQVVQPSLIGLMDGSVSTLAPLFAAAFATQSSWETFLVGTAASVGAGISMGFAEALSDDGSMTGRGAPWLRGVITGAMTTIGGLGHTIPYLIPDFRVATVIAVVVVLIELWIIAWIRARYMDTPFWRAAFQIVVGGLIVFAAGVLIGSA